MRARSFLISALTLTMLALDTSAHPVAQGALDVTVQPEQIDIRVFATNEEAFVAEAFTPSSPREGGFGDICQRHGEYLLQHVFATAAGTSLKGELIEVRPAADKTPGALSEYRLRFAMPGMSKPDVISIRQNVLNELEFAPGNRWEATYVVRISQAGGTAEEGLLLVAQKPLDFVCQWSDAPAAHTTTKRDGQRLFGAYLQHGVMHIMTGYDHMLFMGALALAVASLWDLVKVVSAFTLAHTITLTLCVLGWVRLPTHIVEPMIAASIVIVAMQNIFWERQARGWSRALVAFGFGLFHGLGFAGGLIEAMSDLPGVAVATAIVSFSIGVECGHQAVVLPVFGGILLAGRMLPLCQGRDVTRHFSMKVGSVFVCFAGLFYLAAALRGP